MAKLVRHVMAEAPKAATLEMNALDAAGLMAKFDVGSIPVVDGSTLVGMVTDRDLVVRVLGSREDPSRTRLRDIATRSNLVTVSPDQTLSDARELMSEHRVRRLPVVRDDALVGMVSIGDLAEADPSERAIGEVLSTISESPATLGHNDDGPDPGTPDRVARGRAEEPS